VSADLENSPFPAGRAHYPLPGVRESPVTTAGGQCHRYLRMIGDYLLSAKLVPGGRNL
jgi:hypothetical protein